MSNFISPLNIHFDAYVRAASAAGFMVEQDDTVFVMDLGEQFLIIVGDHHEPEQYMVSYFHKQANDYRALPLFEGSLKDCLKFAAGIE